MPSGARRSSDCWSPADEALAWTTRSHPGGASAGSAKAAPRVAKAVAQQPLGQGVEDFYRARGNALLWLSPNSGAAAPMLVETLKSAAADGLDARVVATLGPAMSPREVAVPDDLAAAMDDAARSAFDGLAFTHRKEWVRWVEEARKPETRTARVTKTVASLRAGKKSR